MNQSLNDKVKTIKCQGLSCATDEPPGAADWPMTNDDDDDDDDFMIDPLT
jgi:hypothetical protein